MKVLYFHQHFSTPKGATGTRSYQFSQALIERGHEVTIVCGSYAGGNTGLSGEPVKGMRTGKVDGINIIEINLAYSNYDSFAKRAWTFVKFALKSIKIALTHDFDLLFATSTPLTAGIPGIAMKFVRRKKFIFEVRDLWPELPQKMGVIKNPVILSLMSLLEWLSYNTADACIGLSPGIKEGIARRTLRKSKRIEMLPNGCDLKLFMPKEDKDTTFFQNNIADYKEQDTIALFTGAHGIANGLDAVLDAAAVLKAKGANDIKLVFIGDGKLKPHLIERAEKENLTNCYFLDPVPKLELADVVASADIGMMILDNIPAFYYGTSPNKFFDYISAGRPVMNNYPGWLADMIQENECGSVVEPGKPEAFADTLIGLAVNKEKLPVMGRNARKLAEREFDRNNIADKFVTLLEQT